MRRREFLSLTAAGTLGILTGSLKASTCAAAGTALRLRFLGTGAADWRGRDARGELRRLSSVLLDSRTLIDFTASAADMLPDGVRPSVVFHTHSHADHYNPEAALKAGVRRVYVHESWVTGARVEYAAAAAKLGVGVPEVLPLAFGEGVVEGGVRFVSLPANHATDRKGERCSMYLVEKGDRRLLYATDTGGIPGEAARLAGIDAHVRPGRPITALVMEATMGVGHADDYRIFAHSSVETVARTVRVLLQTGRYAPPPGRKVFLTHMARTLHGTHAEVAASLPDPLAPAFDGLEVEI